MKQECIPIGCVPQTSVAGNGESLSPFTETPFTEAPFTEAPFQRDPLDRDPTSTETTLTETLQRNMDQGTEMPLGGTWEQAGSQTSAKILPCPKLRLRAVKRGNKLGFMDPEGAYITLAYIL